MIETAGTGARGAYANGGGSTGGLAPRTAIILLFVVTAVVGFLSAATGRGFGVAFNLVYLVVTVYVALRIYVEDRFLAVIAPPIVYAVSVFLASFVDSEQTGRTLKRVIENSIVNVTLGAPWLVLATIATIVIAVVRGRRHVG